MMKFAHRAFLVLLRIAIGWHFLFEGLAKIESVSIGPTETNRPWTSEGYLREANGPFGEIFRRQIGDPDEEALARLTLLPLPPGPHPTRTMLHDRFPPALKQDWQTYFDHFIRFYAWDDPSRQQERDLAEAKLVQCEDNAVYWLQSGVKRVKKAFPSGIVEVDETTPERIAEYQTKLAEWRDKQAKDLPAFGADVYKDRLRTLRGEVNRLRKELVKDLDVQTAEMKKALLDILDDQDKIGADNQPREISDAPARRPVDSIDQITMYGLTAVGAALILGLFTQTACLGGAAFLLLIYLSMPPFPWLPENPRVEGHYFFVNKNLIEMLALLALATTRTGLWVGLDGLVQFFNPWRWRTHPSAEEDDMDRLRADLVTRATPKGVSHGHQFDS
jgi:uncharacterized membrane protein YphA (DoxX/SURF4 family)